MEFGSGKVKYSLESPEQILDRPPKLAFAWG